MSDKLKPCPFCGSEKISGLGIIAGSYAVCDECKARGPYMVTCDESAEAWNRRTDEASRLRDALEEIERGLPVKNHLHVCAWCGGDQNEHRPKCASLIARRALEGKNDG